MKSQTDFVTRCHCVTSWHGLHSLQCNQRPVGIILWCSCYFKGSMERGKVATAEGKVVQQISVHQQQSCLEGNKEGSRRDSNTRNKYAKQNFAEQWKTHYNTCEIN